ncbi:MAG: acyl-CoA thioesterase [Ferruginibacter sp.]
MARIKLTVPEHCLYSASIPVRIADINYGNHLGNDSFVSIIHEARMQWLKQYQYTELDIEGTGLILADLVVEFKAEGFYGDIINVKLHTGEITKVSFEIYYTLSACRNNINTILAYAKTGMVCYNYDAKKVAVMHERLKQLLSGQTEDI